MGSNTLEELKAVVEAAIKSTERTKRAKNIASDLELVDKTINPKDLRFFRIVEKLKEEGLLEGEIERVKDKYLGEIGSFAEELDDRVWEMLTTIELFDEETANHCVETFTLAKDKIDNPLFNGVVLVDEFKNENVSRKQFLISCLLHDVGKIEVPHSVVVNKTTDAECANILFNNKDILVASLRNELQDETYLLPENILNGEKLLTFLHDELHLRPQMLCPVRILLGDLSDEEVEEVEKQLSHVGCSPDDNLLKIMRTHDKYSEEILKSLDMPIEAYISGSHHHSKGRSPKYRIAVGTLQVSVDLSDIIHLADVQNAILSARYYKSDKTPLEALKILAIHAKNGLVDTYFAYIWIADELYRNKDSLSNLEGEERVNFDFVTNFLNEQLDRHLAYPRWEAKVMGTSSANFSLG